MSRVRVPNELFDVDLPAFPRIEGANTLVDFRTKSSQFLHVRQQISADRFLVGFRKVRHLFHGVLELLRHCAHSIAPSLSPTGIGHGLVQRPNCRVGDMREKVGPISAIINSSELPIRR
jgi:hypothetical protein